MSSEPQLFRVNPDNKESERMEEVDFHRLGLRERQDIQEWVAANPGILGDDLLIIGKEFSGFDRTNERLDLLAVDSDGKLVIIELKRDDTGPDAHWQAIKYASYLRRAGTDEIIRVLADYRAIPQEEARDLLIQHIGADDLNALNNDQRIILASHRFAPEVTSAVLWLNEKAPGENLITCVKLTPYQDSKTGSLYIQASAIIPVPGEEEYVVGIGNYSQQERIRGSSFRNRNDEVTDFFVNKVSPLVLDELPDEIKPDKTMRLAGSGSGKVRYYRIWYARPPWGIRGLYYMIHLWPQEESGSWRADIVFRHHGRNDLESVLASISLHDDQQVNQSEVSVPLGIDTLNEGFAKRIAKMARNLIQQITPIVDDLGNERE